MNKKDFLRFIWACVRACYVDPHVTYTNLTRTCSIFKDMFPQLQFVIHTIMYNVDDFVAYVNWTRRYDNTYVLQDAARCYYYQIYNENCWDFCAVWKGSADLCIIYRGDEPTFTLDYNRANNTYKIFMRTNVSPTIIASLQEFFKPYMDSFK